MRREADHFEEEELDLVYMARSLREALRLEKLLTDAAIEYLVETGTYTAGFLLKRDLTGAFFYVSPQDVARAHEVLVSNRFQPYRAE